MKISENKVVVLHYAVFFISRFVGFGFALIPKRKWHGVQIHGPQFTEVSKKHVALQPV